MAGRGARVFFVLALISATHEVREIWNIWEKEGFISCQRYCNVVSKLSTQVKLGRNVTVTQLSTSMFTRDLFLYQL